MMMRECGMGGGMGNGRRSGEWGREREGNEGVRNAGGRERAK